MIAMLCRFFGHHWITIGPGLYECSRCPAKRKGPLVLVLCLLACAGPSEPEWVAKLRTACKTDNGVFFFKTDEGFVECYERPSANSKGWNPRTLPLIFRATETEMQRKA